MKRIVLVLIALAVLPGCEKLKAKLERRAADKAVAAASSADVGDAGITITDSKAGGVSVQTGGGSKLPESWPASVPPYPGSTVTSAVSTPAAKSAVLQTSDAPAKVAAFYKDKLKGKTTELDYGATRVLTSREGKTTTAINISSLPNGLTNISLSIAGL